MTHIWLVTNLQNSPATQLVKETCKELGWTCDHIVPAEQSYCLYAQEAQELFFQRTVSSPDFCFVRMGSAASAESFALLEKVASLGIPTFNSPETLVALRDKAQGSIRLGRSGVPTPRTLAIGADYELEDVKNTLPGPPWVLKTRFSTKGLGVMLVDSERALSSAIDTLLSSHSQVLVQEFISDRSGTDLRVLVVGGKALAAMERQTSKPGEFRSNLYLGGAGTPIEISDDVRDIAESAAQAVRLDVAGVDLLGSEGTFTVAEVNTSPGLGGISKALGRNLAKETLQYLLAASKAS